MLTKQGTMTQTEKGLNREQLRDFKTIQAAPQAMIPGLFNESPLRNAVIPPAIRKAIMKKHLHNSNVKELRKEMEQVRHQLMAQHYNVDAPPGQWRPQHRKSISTMAIKSLQTMPEFATTTYDGLKGGKSPLRFKKLTDD